MEGVSLPVIVMGAGGHSRVVVDLLLASERTIVGYTNLEAPHGRGRAEISFLGPDEVVNEHSPDKVVLANGIGFVGQGRRREELFEEWTEAGYRFPILVHPTANVSSQAVLEQGAQVMMGANVQPGVRLGRNSIANTACSVDHDCEIGDHAHVAPGAVLSGGVRVGNRCFVGAGSTVLPSVSIGSSAVVAAGAAVVRDVEPSTTVAGVPAQPIKS